MRDTTINRKYSSDYFFVAVVDFQIRFLVALCFRELWGFDQFIKLSQFDYRRFGLR